MAIETIGEGAYQALNTASADEKPVISRQVAAQWLKGKLQHDFPVEPPLRPARPVKPELLPPNQMPKRRHIGNQANMVALLHAVAHIEFNAIDLAWDIVCRFGDQMPREFADDWIRVADDEARHFAMIQDRLASYDATYGDLPAHDGLWESAMNTAHNLKARLSVVPMVLEARGLDITPNMIKRFQKASDQESADALQIIYTEEINHVHFGQKWFKFLCDRENITAEEAFQKLVKQYFKGHLKPPFNTEARDKAGFEEAFYLPIAHKPS